MAARSIIFDSRYTWKELYTAAILETDNKRLPERIRLAEESIAFRLISLKAVRRITKICARSKLPWNPWKS